MAILHDPAQHGSCVSHASYASCRLQAQLNATSLKLEQQAAAAAKAVAEECERHGSAERALQQRLQQLTSDLAVSQASAEAWFWCAVAVCCAVQCWPVLCLLAA